MTDKSPREPGVGSPHEFRDTPGTTRTASMIPPQPNAHKSLEYSMSEGSQNGLPLDDSIAAGHRAAVAAAAAAVSDAAATSDFASLGARPKTAQRHSQLSTTALHHGSKLTKFDMSLEMEAEMEGLTLGEGSSQEDWKNLFRKVPKAHEIILDSIDLESALACRLVCKDWRVTVNYYKKLWAKINKVFSMAINL